MKIIIKIILFLNFICSIRNEQPSKCIELIRGFIGDQSEQKLDKSQIEELQRNKCLIVMSPQYKWGQSMNHIIVKIQYLTSTSTAPCDHILFQERSINYDSFEVRRICLHQNRYVIDYRLFVKTYKSLNKNYAFWKETQQNSIVFESLKSPAPYFWPILHSRTSVPMRKPKIWWQILQTYKNELQTYIDYLELESEQKNISSNKNKKTKSKQCDIQFYCNQGNPLYIGSWL